MSVTLWLSFISHVPVLDETKYVISYVPAELVDKSIAPVDGSIVNPSGVEVNVPDVSKSSAGIRTGLGPDLQYSSSS